MTIHEIKPVIFTDLVVSLCCLLFGTVPRQERIRPSKIKWNAFLRYFVDKALSPFTH